MQDDFISYQLTFSHVQSAAFQYESVLQNLFQENKLNYPSSQLYIRIFKHEKNVEVWAGNEALYKLIKTYPLTATSGEPGPKEKEGDLQIPEGFYHLANFNPESKFHLSLKINYPNQVDTVRNKKRENQGSDIYIHGGNETVGCIPIGDENMSELYWLCVKTYAINPVIPLHIFPCKMEENKLAQIYKTYPMNIDFWNSLKPMYSFFQLLKIRCEITGCDDFGNYQLDIPETN